MVVLTNCEESESDRAIEYPEELNCFYSPPSPTYFLPSPITFPPSPLPFPPYSPASPPQPSSSNSSVLPWELYYTYHRNFKLVVLAEYKIQDRGGALDVIPSGRLIRINELVERLEDMVDSKAKYTASLVEHVKDWDRVDEQLQWDHHIRDFVELEEENVEELEEENVDIVYQLVVDSVDVSQFLIQYEAGALDIIRGGRYSWINGSEICVGQLLTSTPEQILIFQTKLCIRLWQGHRGQWVADIRFGWNWLNISTFKIAAGTPLFSESVIRLRGGKDLFDYPFSELSVKKNRAEPRTTPRTEIQMLELPPTEEQENLDKDFELGCSEATGNGGVDAVGIGSWNGCDNTTIQVSQSTLKYACREYAIHIRPTHPNRTPMLVDQEEIPLLNSDTLPSDQALAATIGKNSVLVKEIAQPQSSPAARQENPNEDFVNGQVEPAGIGSEGTEESENAEPQLNSEPFGKRKRKEKTPRGERGNKKTTRVRNVIPLEEISQIKEMHLKDAARHLNVSQSTLKRACREYGINRWPPRNEHKNLVQSLPNVTPAVVNQEGFQQLNSYTMPSDNPLTATVDTNIVIEEMPPPQFSPTAQQENPKEDFGNDELEAVGSVGLWEGEMNEAQLNSECSGNGKRDEKTPSGEMKRPQENSNEDFVNGQVEPIGIGSEGTEEAEITEPQLNSGPSEKRKRKEKTPREEKGNKKTTRVRNVIPLEKILQVKEMRLIDAAEHLKVSPSALKHACREHRIKRWPPRDIHETPVVVDEEESAPLTSDTLRSDQALTATVNTNSVAEETTPHQFSPTVRQEKPDEDSSNDEVEEAGMGGVGTCESEMPRNEMAPGGERGGVRIKIPLEVILKYSHMRIEDAAGELEVSRSTLKRICRDYNISRWPPRDEHKRISQSCPNESPTIVDQERIPQLNSDTPLSANQVSATIDTHSVTVRANYKDLRIKFRLSWPWRMVELEQEVKKRLQFEAGTYYIKYKDEDDGLTLIVCDEDLKDCISGSSPLGTHSIEVFLSQKVAHEICVDQL